MKIKLVVVSGFVLASGALLNGHEGKKTLPACSNENCQAIHESLKKEIDSLNSRVEKLEELLGRSELSRYNAIDYKNFWKWTVEEQVKNSSLIILRRPSEKGDKVEKEILKKGEGVSYKIEEVFDESHALDDYKEMELEGDIIFHMMNPPQSLGGYPIKNGVIYTLGNMSLSEFKKLAGSYDGK